MNTNARCRSATQMSSLPITLQTIFSLLITSVKFHCELDCAHGNGMTVDTLNKFNLKFANFDGIQFPNALA